MVSASSISTSRPPASLHSPRAAWIMAIVLFFCGFTLYTTHNQFPYYYHPDEKGKVWQVANHKRNCHHPLMMLTFTQAAALFHSGPLTSQQIVEKGRAVSAFFAAAAVAAMALLARRMGESVGGALAGTLAGWSAGVLMLTNARTFFLAHFMKEDPALIFGLALAFLALHFYWTRRDAPALVLAGAATAAAVSGKYIGWLLFPFAVAIILRGSTPEARKRHILLFLRAFGIVWAVLNYSVFLDPSKPFRSLGNEMTGVTGGHHGLTKDVPHAAYVRTFLALPPAVTLFFGIFCAGLLARLRKVTLPEWLIPGFGLLLFVLMSFSPKSSSRYFLPVEMIVCFGAGLGIAWSAAWIASLAPRGRQLLLALVWLPLFGWAVGNVTPALREQKRAMTADDRTAFKAWVAQNLPASAVIVEDGRVHLPVPGNEKYAGEPPMAQRIIQDDYAADAGTLAEMRAKGITHVAVDTSTFVRFDNLKPSGKAKKEFENRKAFYASLGVLQGTKPAEGVRQVWAMPIGTNIYLQPGIQLFDITGAAPAQEGQP